MSIKNLSLHAIVITSCIVSCIASAHVHTASIQNETRTSTPNWQDDSIRPDTIYDTQCRRDADMQQDQMSLLIAIKTSLPSQ